MNDLDKENTDSSITTNKSNDFMTNTINAIKWTLDQPAIFMTNIQKKIIRFFTLL